MTKVDEDKDEALRSLSEAFSKVSLKLSQEALTSANSSSVDGFREPESWMSGLMSPDSEELEQRKLSDDASFNELLLLVRDMVGSFHDYVDKSEKALKRRDRIANLTLSVAALSLIAMILSLLGQFGILSLH